MPGHQTRTGCDRLVPAHQIPDREKYWLAARFKDDAGCRWQLDEYMHLEPAPDDEW
jgi:hypothetical protein